MAGKWRSKKGQENLARRWRPVGFLALAVLCAFFLFGKECVVVLRWYGAWLLLSAAALPLALALFPTFADSGYIFSKTLGLLISGGVIWAGAVFRILPFTHWSVFVSAGICFAISAAVFWYRNRSAAGGLSGRIRELSAIRAGEPDRVAAALYTELFFFLLLAYWSYLKSGNPAAYGTEKMMDFGFMMAMDKSPYLPAQDMWFAGKEINYYYVGQFLATYVTKLSGVGVNYGYNLMMMTLPALGFLECFCIVRQLLRAWMAKNQTGGAAWIPTMGGVIAGFADTFAGNMHYVLYALLKIPSQKEGAYYYPDSTRFIGYDPDVADKTIHEFPSYSFMIGDLHAHVLNYIFVLTVTALLLSWVLQRKSRQEGGTEAARTQEIRREKADAARLKKSRTETERETEEEAEESAVPESLFSRLKAVAADALGAEIVLIGIFLGMFQGINYWDFPIYYVVSGAVLLFANIRLYRDAVRILQATAVQGAAMIALAWITATPFRIHFQMIASHVHPVLSHSSPYQLIVLWGLPVLLSIFFFSECFAGFLQTGTAARPERSGKKKAGKWKEMVFRKIPLKEAEKTASAFCSSFARRVLEMPTEDLFAIILSACAAGLVLMPELVYVEDIYGEAYHRANTMFKLTYQSYILFSLCFGYMLPRLIKLSPRKQTGAWIVACLLLLTLGYFHNASEACFGGILGKGHYGTLNGAAFMDELTQADDVSMKDDAEAIRWINENVKGYPVVILEADGDSYTFADRISVFTGQPTILGWRTHEWLWRSDSENPKQYPPEISERDADIRTIYTSENRDEVTELLEKYAVDYVVIGYQERHNSGVWGGDSEGKPDSGALLMSLGEVVFKSEQNAGEPLYIIRLNKD